MKEGASFKLFYPFFITRKFPLLWVAGLLNLHPKREERTNQPACLFPQVFARFPLKEAPTGNSGAVGQLGAQNTQVRGLDNPSLTRPSPPPPPCGSLPGTLDLMLEGGCSLSQYPRALHPAHSLPTLP